MSTPNNYNSFAMYRLPHASFCCMIQGNATSYESLSDLDGKSGFVVAPFNASSELPVALIGIEERRDLAVDEVGEDFMPELSEWLIRESKLQENLVEGNDSNYPFDAFHDGITSGKFHKIVLSRSKHVSTATTESPFLYFKKACERYPRLFIALVYTPQSGLWLTATPEQLISGGDNKYSTMALAGTMPLPKDQQAPTWSDKNMQEQRMVATYIGDCLRKISDGFTEEGPRTVRAAQLIHLRSDFTFTLNGTTRLGQVISLLHPTPAVCGLPKDDTLEFILSHEAHSRRYYSGFMGLLNADGYTLLYMSLRCMQIAGKHFRLYAGGGLLKDSTREQEYNETEDKMETMLQLLDDNI